MIDQLLNAQEVSEMNELGEKAREMQQNRLQGVDTDAQFAEVKREELDAMTEDRRNQEGDATISESILSETQTTSQEKDKDPKEGNLEKIKIATQEIQEYGNLMRLFINQVKDDREKYATGNFINKDENVEKFDQLAKQLAFLDDTAPSDETLTTFSIVENKLRETWFPEFNRVFKVWSDYYDGHWQDQQNCREQWGRIVQMQSELERVAGIVRSTKLDNEPDRIVAEETPVATG